MSRMLKQVISILLAAALLIPTSWIAPVTEAAVQDTTVSSDTVTVYHETFASGKGIAAQAGSASLTPVTDKVFAGNADGAALYVSNRANNWDAADFKFSDMGLENGKTYTVTASVYVDADVIVPSGAQAYLQAIGSYALLANVNYEAGQAVTLTKEFTVDTDKDTTLRVQSNDDGKTVPFYIGDVLVTEKVATVEPTPTPETPRDPALPLPLLLLRIKRQVVLKAEQVLKRLRLLMKRIIQMVVHTL